MLNPSKEKEKSKGVRDRERRQNERSLSRREEDFSTIAPNQLRRVFGGKKPTAAIKTFCARKETKKNWEQKNHRKSKSFPRREIEKAVQEGA